MLEDVLAGHGLKLVTSGDVYCASLFEKLHHECSLDLIWELDTLCGKA